MTPNTFKSNPYSFSTVTSLYISLAVLILTNAENIFQIQCSGLCFLEEMILIIFSAKSLILSSLLFFISFIVIQIRVQKTFLNRIRQIYEDLNFKLPPAGIVGVIGPNGAGKTTLFRMIMGQDNPDHGSFSVGETVKIAYVDQQHADIDPNKTIWEQITDGKEQINVGGKLMNSRAYVAKFNFSGSDQNKKVGVLSGGERNRLHLALTLRKEANVLLLDEPTNDLDVNTLRALEEGLDNFAGCAVIISHDRWFLDRICTHILAFEGNSSVYYYEGGFSDYEENRRNRLGDISPTRIKYKKLKR